MTQASTGKTAYLSELLSLLINKADDALPGSTGREKEDWIVDKVNGYIEANDAEFLTALVAYSRLPIQPEQLTRIVDSDLADGIQAKVQGTIIRTAVRLAYGSELVQRYLTRKEDLTAAQEAEFEKVKAQMGLLDTGASTGDGETASGKDGKGGVEEENDTPDDTPKPSTGNMKTATGKDGAAKGETNTAKVSRTSIPESAKMTDAEQVAVGAREVEPELQAAKDKLAEGKTE